MRISAIGVVMSLVPVALSAQRVTVTLRADSAHRLVAPSSKLAVPVILDLGVRVPPSVLRF